MRQVMSCVIDLRRTWMVPVFAGELKNGVRLAEPRWCCRRQGESVGRDGLFLQAANYERFLLLDSCAQKELPGSRDRLSDVATTAEGRLL
jgi:hypothetical protein